MRMTNLSGFNPIQKNVTTSGTPVKLSGYYVSTTVAFVAGTAGVTRDTITDSNSQFLNMGFQVGDKLVVSGSTTSDGTYEIFSITSGTITLANYEKFISEIAGDSITLDTLHGIKVEDGVSVVLKAKDGNAGTITLAPTSARALNTNTAYFSHFSLVANQAIGLQIKNLNEVWMDATSSSDGVQIIFEK